MITLDVAKIAVIALLVWHGAGLTITGLSIDNDGDEAAWSFVGYLLRTALIILAAMRIYGIW